MNRLKELRQKKSISQSELADLLGVSSSQIYYYESGQRSPRSEYFWKEAADYFGVSVAYIMGLEEKTDYAKAAEIARILNNNPDMPEEEKENLKKECSQLIDRSLAVADDESKAHKRKKILEEPALEFLHNVYREQNKEGKEALIELVEIFRNLEPINREKVIEQAEMISLLQNHHNLKGNNQDTNYFSEKRKRLFNDKSKEIKQTEPIELPESTSNQD